jgi:hypothetical protein
MGKPDPVLVDETVVLSAVITEVQQALADYQEDPDVAGGKGLPPLASADFEFKTVVDEKAGITFSVLIFKFGHTVDHQVINDVVFHYVPPPPPKPENISSELGAVSSIRRPPISFKSQLTQDNQGGCGCIPNPSK